MAEGNEVHIDHIVAVSRGGTNDIANLRVLHKFCNMSKGSKTDEEHAAQVVAYEAAWSAPDYDGEVMAGEPLYSYPLSHPNHIVTVERVERGLFGFGIGWLVKCSCGWVEAQPIRPEVDAVVACTIHDYSITHVPPVAKPLQFADHEVKTCCISGPGYDGWRTNRWIGHCVCGYHTVARSEEEVDAAIEKHWDNIKSD